MEIWKDIENYEGFYQVSNYGNIRSLDRYVNHNYGGLCFVKGKNLTGNVNKSGYRYFIATKNGIRKTIKVHQAVAICFLNHKPCGMKFVINHKDFNKLNNKIDNLEIVTNRENSNKKHIKSSSKYTGVSYHKLSKKWIALIFIDGKNKYLGLFKNEIDAHLAYENELKKIKIINENISS